MMKYLIASAVNPDIGLAGALAGWAGIASSLRTEKRKRKRQVEVFSLS
jgi:hypothetical protein